MQPGFVRIIAGKWRGRRLKVLDGKGLRPTPDRVRETLFNWLAPSLNGAHCLDLFAGSGALGFECLSRGAASVTMFDQSKEVVQLLQQTLLDFGADNAEIYCASVPDGLTQAKNSYDIVFVDPPYQSDLLVQVCTYLENNKFLAENALIYLESARALEETELPTNWRIVKSKKTGQVYYHLVAREVTSI